MTPRFSIVTITLNSERYLAETLASVANQTFSDFEHILWDGGSTDTTLEIARSFPHVQVIQGKDAGIADALNRAMALTKGRWIVGLHSDDLLVPAALERLALYDHSWICGCAEMIDEEGAFLHTTDFIPFNAARLRRYNIITHPAVALHRELALEGYRTDLRYAMDYELWLRLAQKHEALAIPDVIAKFRLHEGSLSTREKLAVTDEAYRVRNEYVLGPLERWRSFRTWKKRRKREAMLYKQRAISAG